MAIRARAPITIERLMKHLPPPSYDSRSFVSSRKSSTRSRISQPRASDLAFMCRVLAKEVEPISYRTRCAKRYCRAITVAESANEADRCLLTAVSSPDHRRPVAGHAGRVIDDLLEQMRIDLATIEEQLSIAYPLVRHATLEEDLRIMKMDIATFVGDRSHWRMSAEFYWAAYDAASPLFADRFDGLNSLTAIFVNHHISPPYADDLAFMCDILESNAERVLHRVQCGRSLAQLMRRVDDNKVASKLCRHAIGVAGNAPGGDYYSTIRVSGSQKCTGDLIDDAVVILRGLLALSEAAEAPPVPRARTDVKMSISERVPAASHAPLREAILERALHMPESVCDMCGASGGTHRVRHCACCKWAAYCSAACQWAA
ncbi:hypothetical protein BDK51DRAFT_50225 [Blyttiomyces helicus]|uniref:MYND-type domain-containing protein n=1 Tax=Blyttiomyces helicus TaxID=388810 RepID=A0A4P9WQ21_9FUNG|nr:hypothetical protein BDK51DRAFT_50225 [Blyttiomyces helicus]|eukprot:RKO92946.1 hypothetical protein BDK51DRAFT_50225 [Blyttiomyces helicus]